MSLFDSAHKAANNQINSATAYEDNISLLSAAELPESFTLEDLYRDLLSDERNGKNDEDLRDALVLASCLEQTERLSRQDGDEDWRGKIEVWLVKEALPDGKVFTVDESLGKYADFKKYPANSSTDDKTPEKELKAKQYRYKYTLLLTSLSNILSLRVSPTTPPSDPTLLSLICYTSPKAPWNTSQSHTLSTTLLAPHKEYLESPAFLITYLLQTFIKPLFSHAPRPTTITPAARKAASSSAPPRHFDFRENHPENQPWRSGVPYAMIVLEWIVGNIDPSLLRSTAFPLLIPPLLTLLDSPSNSIRMQALSLLLPLFPKLSAPLLTQTGLASVFQDAISPICLFLPSLTPLEDSVRLLPRAYEVLWGLGGVLFEDSEVPVIASNEKMKEKQKEKQKERIKFYTTILQHSLLPSFLSTQDSPQLLLILLPALSTLVQKLGIYTVKYLKDIIPLLASILLNPLWLISVQEVVIQTLWTLREVMLVGWMRIGRREWRLRVLEGLVGVGGGVRREEGELEREGGKGGERETKKKVLEDVKHEIRETAKVFIVAVRASDDKEIREEFEDELRDVVKADERLGYIFAVVE
ncbi:tRNA nucleotidyltransferase protein [Rutstroemia sp. NJR-2017a WRK4]|nr:tRNA nucleotidyltransferase protein [Rutstroemia sp. NJR-2017a WRK4]